MKHLALIITMAFVAGLFAAGQAIGGGHEMGKAPMSGSSMGEKVQMHQKHHMAGHKLNREQVREMQNLLDDHGFNAGPADGYMGSRTKEALRQFQESEGLTATGTPDQETLRALAPSVEKQEFFGLSPEFGGKTQEPMQPEGKQMKQMMEKQHMEQQPMKQEGSKY
jgi:hypothetical protein